MKRFHVMLGGACALCLAIVVNHAWTQDEDTVERKIDRTPQALSEDRNIYRGQHSGIANDLATEESGMSSMGMSMGMRRTVDPDRIRTKLVPKTYFEKRVVEISEEEYAQFKTFQNALKALNGSIESKDQVAHKAAIDTIRRYLADQFERDLKQREQELVAAEAKLQSLRKQFDKRALAKDEIIGLRLKQMLNQADGLGFPGDDPLNNNAGPTSFDIDLPPGVGGPPRLSPGVGIPSAGSFPGSFPSSDLRSVR